MTSLSRPVRRAETPVATASRRRPTRQARLAWLLALACIACYGVLVAGSPPSDPGAEILIAATILTPLGVGALLVSRVPGNAIGWWLVLAGVLLTATIVATVATTIGALAEPVPWPGAGWAWLLAQTLEIIFIVIVIIVVPLHFPDGRLPSRRWRWIQWLTVIAISANTVVILLGPARDGPNGVGELANPLATPGLAPLLDALGTVALVTGLPAFLGAAASVVVRYRHAARVERQQLKWLLAVASVAAVAFVASFIVSDDAASDFLYTLGFAAIAALPVAIGIAILRYHLYDIDRLISRTLSWAIVTGVLFAAFLGALILLQAALARFTEGQTVAVAASTLVAFALFQPVRRRVQAAIDRRFDRTAYDQERVVAAFGDSLRHEVDLETLSAEIRQAASETVRPATSALWLRIVPDRPAAARPVTMSGRSTGRMTP